MAQIYEQSKGKPFSELLRLYWERAQSLGFGESGVVMTTLYSELIDLLYQAGDSRLPTRDDVSAYLEHCKMKKLIK